LIRIKVIIHSYKNKNLQSYVNELIQNSSKNNLIEISLYDQTNISRNKDFSEIDSVKYTHIKWYDHRGPNHYRLRGLAGSYDSILFLSDSVILGADWDSDLLEAAAGADVVSMFGKEVITHDNFFIDVKRSPSENITRSIFVNPDMLFLSKDLAILMEKTQHLKVLGVSEELSVRLYEQGATIASMPYSFAQSIHTDSFEYRPYSRTHNYSRIYSTLLSDSGQNFCKDAGIRVFNMKKYPYEINDVLYFDPISSLDESPSGSKFHSIKQKIMFSEMNKQYKK
jgi:hypothetical protein